MGELIAIRPNFSDKLHNTCQPGIYYTAFDNLPGIITDFICKEYLTLYEVENSKYTVFKDALFIRHRATIDGVNYKLEISLGDITDSETEDNYEDDNQVDSMAHEMLECFDWNCYDVYLEVI